MKDWEIYRSTWFSFPERPRLLHLHPDKDWKICHRDDDGEWYCSLCGEKAPEEIQFVADMARCDPYNDRVC